MKKMSTWAKLELSRELRQWIGLIGAGVAVSCAWMESHPESKMKFESWIYEAKKKLHIKK